MRIQRGGGIAPQALDDRTLTEDARVTPETLGEGGCGHGKTEQERGIEAATWMKGLRD
jgi:hypothetical protein